MRCPTDTSPARRRRSINFLNGGPALPSFTPPRPFESGVGRRPTLVQNAETAAHVALIARHGAGWFRRVGTAAEPGTALFSLSGAVARPGVYEAALGAPLKALVGAAGGLLRPPRAVLVGGYAGAWIDARAAADLTLDDSASLAWRDPWSGTVAVLPEGRAASARRRGSRAIWPARAPGQCGPCVHGLAALASRARSASRPLPARPPRRRGARKRRVPSPGRRCAARSVGPLGLRTRARDARRTIVQSGRPRRRSRSRARQ